MGVRYGDAQLPSSLWTVTPQVAGRITERHVRDGENLKKGQLPFLIVPRSFKAQLDLAQANLAQAKAAL